MRHEAADAESAPMPLAMPRLVPRHALPYYNIREKVVKVASLLRSGDPGFSRALAGPGVPVKGAYPAYPGVIITTCTSHLGTVERVTRLLSHLP